MIAGDPSRSPRSASASATPRSAVVDGLRALGRFVTREQIAVEHDRIECCAHASTAQRCRDRIRERTTARTAELGEAVACSPVKVGQMKNANHDLGTILSTRARPAPSRSELKYAPPQAFSFSAERAWRGLWNGTGSPRVGFWRMKLVPDMYAVRELVALIDDGKLAIPDFQRRFVWRPPQVADLLVSVARRWPIGSLLLLEGPQDFAARALEGAQICPLLICLCSTGNSA